MRTRMSNTEHKYKQYGAILKEELVPAAGCTEPIAIAYAAANARLYLERCPQRSTLKISGYMVKNVKGAVVPNTGGMRGINAALAAGYVFGVPAKKLEVIAEAAGSQREAMKDFCATHPVVVECVEGGESLYLELTAYAADSWVQITISGGHANITKILVNGVKVYDGGAVPSALTPDVPHADRSLLNIHDILDYASSELDGDVVQLLEKQIWYNSAVSAEGIKGGWGAEVGRTLLAQRQDIATRARAAAAAGSDARMSGCKLPVVILSGSGNQGLTASLPVVEYARFLQADEERLYRALIVADLITVHQKSSIGKLSAFCGAVSAGCGAACGIAYLKGENEEGVNAVINNALAMCSGMICDGAKPSCAAKIAMAVEAGLQGYELYKRGMSFSVNDGIIGRNAEETVTNVGAVARLGMRETEDVILKIMTGTQVR